MQIVKGATVRRGVRTARVAMAAMVLGLSAMGALAFEPQIQTQGGTTLQLNGAGIRYRAIFKVYEMGLYLPRKATTVEEVLAMPGPKRLSFVALRDIPGTDLGVQFIKGLSNNSSQDLIRRHTPNSTRLIDIFSGKPKLSPGDTFAMEYQPGAGTTFYIQGQRQGAPVGDAEFFEMVLKVWLGNVPVDFKLKDALLKPTP